ncbi:hypothetical protein MPSI1_002251 [Malassezia psittaci]|uniref:Peroxisomal membrane protein PEX14-like KPWE domain-containing protein n=1 Tax=Malassezia psittaci TaxID=1821823 RepID=A0AAF0JED6_9BASI|nr:hypothetical protein MPSI1_002251 [Malassezia psittaci]
MAAVDTQGSEDDAEFVLGTRAIVEQLMAQGASDEEIRHTLEHARKFYYEQKSQQPSATTNTTHDSASLQTAKTDQSNNQAQSTETYPASFNAIVEMIATGQEDKISGIRDIPLKINEAPPSVSALPRPKKPWEASP